LSLIFFANSNQHFAVSTEPDRGDTVQFIRVLLREC
jgi:hypothetical protein